MAGYPSTHRARARACKKQAGNRCEQCGQPNRTLGLNKRGELTMFYLHAAHTYHDTTNPDAAYICLCPACHDAYDKPHRDALRQLDRRLRTTIVRPAHLATPEGEEALRARHARLLAQEQADMQAARTAGAVPMLKARALWSRCKRLSLELQIARQIVASDSRAWRSSRVHQQVLCFYRTKRDAYLLTKEAYYRLMAPLPQEAPLQRPW